MADQEARIDIVADPSKGNAGFDSFAARVASAGASVKSTFAAIATNVREMQARMAENLGLVESKIASTKQRFSEMSAGIAAVSKDVKTSFDKMKDDAETAAKGLAIGFAIGLVSVTAAAVYTAVKLVLGAYSFIKGLITGDSYKSDNIDALSKQVGVVKDLGNALHVSAQEAGATADAMARLGVSKGDIVSAYDGASKSMRENGDELDRLGIQYKDSNGQLLTQRTFLQNVKAELDKYSEGFDRNAAAAAIGAGSYEAINAALKITQQEVQASKARIDEFNLGIGPETIAAEEAYQQAMRDFRNESELTSQGFKRAVADQIMPILTDLAVFFKDGFPTAVNVFRYTLATVTTLFYGLKNSAYIVAESVLGSFEAIATGVGGVAVALLRLVKGDFRGASAALASGFEGARSRMALIGDNIVAQVQANSKAIRAAWALDERTLGNMGGPGSEGKGGKTWTPKPKEDDPAVEDSKSRMAAWAAELAARKLAFMREQEAQGTFHQFSKEAEAQYWRDILATLDQNDKLRGAVELKSLDLSLEIGRARFEGLQAELANRIDATKGNYAEQEMLADMYAQRAKDHYGQDSKEYQAALKTRLAVYRAHFDSLREQENIRRGVAREDQLEDIAILERGAELERSLGTITQLELLEIKRSGIELRRQIETQAKEAEIQAMKDGPNDPVALERLMAELAAIRRRYSGLAAQNEGDQKVEKNKPFEAIFGASQQAIEQGLLSMVTNMKITLGGLRDVLRSIGTAMLQELVTKPLAAWIVGQAKMVALTWLFGKDRAAAEATTAGQVLAINAALSIKKIAMSAYEAAAAAYASIAAIPIIGPILAPVSAGIALAAVASFGKRIFSAEGGFDIPKGMNPMIQAHSAEMVLPQRQADVIRSLGDMFASGQGLGGDADMNVHIHAKRLPHGYSIVSDDELIAAFKRIKRNFKI